MPFARGARSLAHALPPLFFAFSRTQVYQLSPTIEDVFNEDGQLETVLQHEPGSEERRTAADAYRNTMVLPPMIRKANEQERMVIELLEVYHSEEITADTYTAVAKRWDDECQAMFDKERFDKLKNLLCAAQPSHHRIS